MAVWSKHANSARLALPLLRTANLLYDDCGMHRLPDTHDFPGEQLFISASTEEQVLKCSSEPYKGPARLVEHVRQDTSHESFLTSGTCEAGIHARGL